MRIVAKIILGAIELALIVLIGLPLSVYVGITKLLDWAELHGHFEGDRDAMERARWRNS